MLYYTIPEQPVYCREDNKNEGFYQYCMKDLFPHKNHSISKDWIFWYGERLYICSHCTKSHHHGLCGSNPMQKCLCISLDSTTCTHLQAAGIEGPWEALWTYIRSSAALLGALVSPLLSCSHFVLKYFIRVIWLLLHIHDNDPGQPKNKCTCLQILLEHWLALSRKVLRSPQVAAWRSTDIRTLESVTGGGVQAWFSSSSSSFF